MFLLVLVFVYEDGGVKMKLFYSLELQNPAKTF